MTHRYGHRQQKSRGQNGTWLHALLPGVHSRRVPAAGVHEECNGRWPWISLASATTSDRSWPPGRRSSRENNGISRSLFITRGGHVYLLPRQGLTIYRVRSVKCETAGNDRISRHFERERVHGGREGVCIQKNSIPDQPKGSENSCRIRQHPGRVFRPARARCKHSLTGERRCFGKLTIPRRIPCGSLLCELDSPPPVEYLALARHPHPRP